MRKPGTRGVAKTDPGQANLENEAAPDCVQKTLKYFLLLNVANMASK
jgi:hypothetical protein